MSIKNIGRRKPRPIIIHPKSMPKHPAIILPSMPPIFPGSSRSNYENRFSVDVKQLATSRFPMPPESVIANYSQLLTKRESEEIFMFKEIYFIRICGPPVEPDTDPEFFQFIQDSHILFRYQMLSVLGKGSFGISIKCFDHKFKKCVAIKVIKDNPIIHPQVEMEIQMHQAVSGKDISCQENVLHLLDYAKYRSYVFLVFELLSNDIFTTIKTEGFQRSQLVTACRQIVSGISFIHSLGFIHCDLKPENILWTTPRKKCVKIIDFGSSCRVNHPLFTYIQSRFYRSPEVILGLPYNQSIDIWSLGCLFVEMLVGYPLFPGQSEIEQLALFYALLGPPPIDMVMSSPKKDEFYNGNELKIPIPITNNLLKEVKQRDSLFHSVIMCCLKWRGSDRIRAKDILRNPWFRPVGPKSL